MLFRSTVDANGCSATVSLTVPNVDSIEIELNTSNISCYGLNDGKITAAITGGTPQATGYGYNVIWTPQQTGTPDTLNNLSVGVYTLILQDANGCSASASTAVLEPNPMTIQVDSLATVTCPNNNGHLRLSVLGGPSVLDGISGAYAFSIDGGLSFGATTNPVDYPNLSGGFFDIVARDVNYPHCISLLALTLGDYLEGSLETTDETCAGMMDGTASIIPVGGTSVTTVWFLAGNVLSVDDTVTNLVPNIVSNGAGGLDTLFNYVVTLSDTNNCSFVDTFYIHGRDSLLALAIDHHNGTATASALGGQGPYSYLWGNNANNQTTATATGLSDSVSYSVTITDAFGCKRATSVTINVGISEIEQLTYFECFPNPTNGDFFVNIQFDNVVPFNLELKNVLGQVVFAEKYQAKSFQNKIVIENHIPSGVYFLNLNVGRQQQSKKITLFR